MAIYMKSRCAWISVALATAALSGPVLAQQVDTSKDAQSTTPQPEEKTAPKGKEEKKVPKKKEELEEVVVTGSNIRTDLQWVPALPLTVVTAADIALKGPQEISATLRENPLFSGGTLNGGSGGFFSGAVETLNLLGLGDKYTLVLVDGRRFNAVTPANIANIPTGAISDIQILTDGGSSIYGSDAVAGVVNIILNKHYDGMEISSSYGDRAFGADFGTHANDWLVELKFGANGDRARFYGDMEFHKRGGTNIVDTQEGRTANLWENQVYTSPSNIILPNGNNVILNYHVFPPGSYSLNPADYIPYNPTDYNSTIGQLQRAMLQDRQPQQDVSGVGYAEYDLTDKAILYSQLYYSNFRSTEQNEQWGVDFYGDSHLDFGPVPATNYWNPFKVPLADVYYELPELGGVQYTGTIYTWRVVGGVKGEVGPLAYDVGATYFWNDQTDHFANFYSDAGLQAAINRPGPAALNPFCYGCNTPAQVAGINVSQQLETVSAQSIFDAKISGPLLKRDNSGISFAAGAETRQEKWTFSVDPLTATGDVYFNQFSPDYQQQRTSAVFGELAYDLEAGADIPAVHKLTVDASVRHDWIESVGGTTNPHYVVAWQPVSPAFMLRGSYGTSFTAPPISLLRAQTQVVNAVLIYPQFNNQTIPTDVIAGGNPNLQPETATTLNFGVVIAPSQLPGSSLTVEHFYVKQRDVVLVPDPQAIVDGTFPGTVTFVPGGRPIINAVARNVGGRNVKGWDFTLNSRYPTAKAGTFGFKYNGVYVTQFDVNNGPGYMSVLGVFDNYLFNYSSVGALGTIPRLRFQGGPNWSDPSGTITASVTANFVGHYHDAGVAAGFPTDRWVSHFLTYDFNLNADLKRFVPGLSGSLGILNIFSTPPPYVQGFGETYVYYDPGLSNSLGRWAFIGLKYHF
jgi:iron complex outermembrane recepter protein